MTQSNENVQEPIQSLPIGEQVILVELDALLDTRLAVAATLDEEAWNEIAANPDYFHRECDDLSLFTDRFTKEQYLEAWKNRNKSCLRHALITNYIREISRQSSEMHRDLVNKNNPHVTRVEFKINTHPYELNEEEKKDIVECIENYVMPGTEVTVCRLPPTVLNFAYLRMNFTGLVLYNFTDWMESCEKPDYDGPGAPQVTVIAPALFTPEGRPPEEEIQKALRTNEHVGNDALFGLTEYTLTSVISLALQDVKWFSVILPER